MSGSDFIVPPRSWAELDQVGQNLRDELARVGLEDEPMFPIMEVMEMILCNQVELFDLLVGSRLEMGNAEGVCCPEGTFIMLREDVYEGAWAGVGRDRFTAAHELAHRFLHTGLGGLQRVEQAAAGTSVKTYCMSEPQANHLAGAILMPARFFNSRDDEDSVVARHGVSKLAAASRLRYFRKKGII